MVTQPGWHTYLKSLWGYADTLFLSRTATNVSGDMFAAKIMEKITGIKDTDASHIEVRDESESGGSMTDTSGPTRKDEKNGDRV